MNDRSFNNMGNALNMSFTDYASTTWEFFFTGTKDFTLKGAR
jgi:hypothetical protein